MGIFGSIMDKLFHHSTAQAATPSQTASQPTSGTAGAGQQAQAGTAAQQPQTGSSAMGTAMSPGATQAAERRRRGGADPIGEYERRRRELADFGRRPLEAARSRLEFRGPQRSRQRAQRACRRRRQCRTKYRASESRHGENRRKRRQSAG